MAAPGVAGWLLQQVGSCSSAPLGFVVPAAARPPCPAHAQWMSRGRLDVRFGDLIIAQTPVAIAWAAGPHGERTRPVTADLAAEINRTLTIRHERPLSRTSPASRHVEESPS
ncbi:hypothetical protein GCM10027074_75500 [Streptomyces deserti]